MQSVACKVVVFIVSKRGLISEECPSLDKALRYALLICDHIGATTLWTLNFSFAFWAFWNLNNCSVIKGQCTIDQWNITLCAWCIYSHSACVIFRMLPLLIPSLIFIDLRVLTCWSNDSPSSLTKIRHWIIQVDFVLKWESLQNLEPQT